MFEFIQLVGWLVFYGAYFTNKLFWLLIMNRFGLHLTLTHWIMMGEVRSICLNSYFL